MPNKYLLNYYNSNTNTITVIITSAEWKYWIFFKLIVFLIGKFYQYVNKITLDFSFTLKTILYLYNWFTTIC